jgi:phosphate transport system substrate-binding protein
MSDTFLISPVAPEEAMQYRTSNGAKPETIVIGGSKSMQPLLLALCDLFTKRNRKVEFRLVMRGSSTAFAVLASDACHIAAMSRPPGAGDRASFRSAKGHAPRSVRIGYSGHGPRPGAPTPPALYVHPSNPLSGLSMADVARIFSSGSLAGDINFWDQLGLHGEWAGRRIHLYGPRDDGQYASGFREAHLAGRTYAFHYEALPDEAAIVRAVAQDPCGIGSIGRFDAGDIAKQVRILPLSTEPNESVGTPSLENVGAGTYPLSFSLHLYCANAPEAPIHNLLANFLRFALSDEAQMFVAQFTSTPEGFVRLSVSDLARERKKVASARVSRLSKASI